MPLNIFEGVFWCICYCSIILLWAVHMFLCLAFFGHFPKKKPDI